LRRTRIHRSDRPLAIVYGTADATLGIRLLDAEPGIGRFLSDNDRAAARRIVVPTHVIPKGQVAICQLLEDFDCFGAIVLEGMLLNRVGIADHVALRLLGPGDLISLSKQSSPLVLSETDCRALTKTRVMLLGREVLTGTQRWPQLLAGLNVRFTEQSERVVAQLAICQLSRVEQRLMSMMWLLAESWGRVTAAGTFLPMTLTHDVLGGLVGARRSTVTLAIGELADQGALIRQDDGWLLLAGPPSASGKLPEFEDVQLVTTLPSAWHADARGRVAPFDPQYLHETVQRLREEFRLNQQQVRAQLERAAAFRASRDELRRAGNGQLIAPPIP
jgi:CRP/FNR family transcriptional regulator, cyclic AMP receptor protein